MTGDLGGETQEVLDDDLALRPGDGEGRRGADAGDGGDVAARPLEFRKDDPERDAARRNVGAGQRLQRLAEGQGVRKSRVATESLCQQHDVGRSAALGKLLDRTVLVEGSAQAPLDDLAGALKHEHYRLRRVAVDGADRQGVGARLLEQRARSPRLATSARVWAAARS